MVGVAAQRLPEALVEGWRYSMWVSAAMAALTLAFVVWRAPRRADEVSTLDEDLDAELAALAADAALASS